MSRYRCNIVVSEETDMNIRQIQATYFLKNDATHIYMKVNKKAVILGYGMTDDRINGCT